MVTLYVCDDPAQAGLAPEIADGCAGVVAAVTDKVRAILEPQVLFAVTEIVPDEAPDATLTEIELVVLVPVQPVGKVHEYDEAKGSLVTL